MTYSVCEGIVLVGQDSTAYTEQEKQNTHTVKQSKQADVLGKKKEKKLVKVYWLLMPPLVSMCSCTERDTHNKGMTVLRLLTLKLKDRFIMGLKSQPWKEETALWEIRIKSE